MGSDPAGGPARGKSVLIQKLHHAIADGQGAVQLGLALLDFTPEGNDLGPMPEAPEPVVLDTRDSCRRWSATTSGGSRRLSKTSSKALDR